MRYFSHSVWGWWSQDKWGELGMWNAECTKYCNTWSRQQEIGVERTTPEWIVKELGEELSGSQGREGHTECLTLSGFARSLQDVARRWKKKTKKVAQNAGTRTRAGARSCSTPLISVRTPAVLTNVSCFSSGCQDKCQVLSRAEHRPPT
jgi:hypothetical protein